MVECLVTEKLKLTAKDVLRRKAMSKRVPRIDGKLWAANARL